MPRSNGRPINRLKRSVQDARVSRNVDRYLKKRHPEIFVTVRGPKPSPDKRSQQLADRRDYRQSLIHRLSNAHGARKMQLEQRLKETERQIAELK